MWTSEENRSIVRSGAAEDDPSDGWVRGVDLIDPTLLILSIQVPQIQGDTGPVLTRTLLAMTPKFLSYALSFGIVYVRWVRQAFLLV